MSFGDPQAVGRVEVSTPPAPPGTPPYVLTPVPAEKSEVEEASPEGPQVLIELHRTSKVQGKQVTEYCVLLATWHRSYMSWHRYTDFKVLHDSLAPTLDLGPFPVPAFPIFNDQHKDGRAKELQACLRACIAVSVAETTARQQREGTLEPFSPASLPTALRAFLFTPTTLSTSEKSQSSADMNACGMLR